MFVVWQEKPRVVTDHSASGLNDGIPRSEAKVQYDDMHPFGRTLRDVKAKHAPRRIILFKSDVSSAFLNFPAHPIWQIRQTVIVDKLMYIVRRLVFGNRASPRCWCAVSGLLCWIATRKLDYKNPPYPRNLRLCRIINRCYAIRLTRARYQVLQDSNTIISYDLAVVRQA
jgi:hypothetical protein